jgi:hypothetical protein
LPTQLIMALSYIKPRFLFWFVEAPRAPADMPKPSGFASAAELFGGGLLSDALLIGES